MLQSGPGTSVRFIDIIRTLDTIMREVTESFITGFSLTSLLILLSVSFIYGIVHSAGPGHGKSLVASFFIKEEHPLKKSFTLAVIISFIHTGSAIILSLLLFYILTGIKGMFRIQLQSYFMIASGVLITVIGIFFLFTKLIRDIRKKEEAAPGSSNLILVGISAGIVPCPLALMIMLFTLSQGIMLYGLLSVLSISAGMLFLLMLVGVLSIKSREGIINLSEKSFSRYKLVPAVLEYGSVILIIFIGLSMSSGFIMNLMYK